jgi:hypothetical protein
MNQSLAEHRATSALRELRRALARISELEGALRERGVDPEKDIPPASTPPDAQVN